MTIDVGFLLKDPDFVSPMTIIHRTVTVSTHGEVSVTEASVNTYGSIQPVSGKELHRIPEALRVSDVRTFYVNLEVITDGTNLYPDLIVFNGKRYQVVTTNPWMNWGHEWNSGICVGEKPNA